MAEISRLTAKLKQREFKLNALLEVTQAINTNFEVSQLLGLYQRILKEELGVEKLALFTFEEQWTCLVQYGMQNTTLPNISDERFFQKQKDVELNVGESTVSFDLSLPIVQNERPIAYLLVGDEVENEIKMSPAIRHMKFIQTITNIIVVAIQNKKFQEITLRQERVKKELELAAEMQAILLPHQLPNNQHFEVSAVYKAHQQVGGDYYDFMELPDDKVMFCMADVSGKGVSAAFLMANFQAYLRSVFTYTTSSLTEIVRELNRLVMHSAMGEKYITLFLGLYDKPSRKLHYINCGHNPPILADSNGYTTLLKNGTLGLGMFDELPKVLEGVQVIQQRSIVTCFTDGLVETENEEDQEFGSERLENLILSYFDDPVADLNDIIVEALNDFKGSRPYVDDLAIMSCRFR
jgi:sigma-B regulation protein RsbU (phosphoserine phosphatase)